MGQEQGFSTARLVHAIKDAWLSAKGVLDVILKGAAGLAFLGFLGFAAFKPEMLMPPSLAARAALVALFLLMFLVPVRVAYRLRCELETEAIPEADRNLILELKRVAGEVVHDRISFFPPTLRSKEEQYQLQDDFQRIFSKLRQYRGIYREASIIAEGVGPLVAMKSQEDINIIEERFKKLVDECDKVLQARREESKDKGLGALG